MPKLHVSVDKDSEIARDKAKNIKKCISVFFFFCLTLRYALKSFKEVQSLKVGCI